MTTATISAPQATSAPPPTTGLTPYRFSVEDYHKMIDAGILPEGGPAELIEGIVVRKMPKNPAHETAFQRIRKRIERLVGAGWEVRPGSPITLTDSEPEPDVAVARGTDADYETRHPGPTDLTLVIEVSVTTLSDDRGVMARTYARDGIVEYWIVNVPHRQIEVYTQPSGPAAAPAYAQTHIYAAGSSVPLTLDGVVVGAIAVDDVLS